MDDCLNKKAITATKWSGLSQVVSKLVHPVVSMVLARLLTPEAFGVVATLNMVITFAEIFTDSGFHKYLVQHEFKDDKDRQDSTNVAFWSNLSISLMIWGVIAIFSEPLATLVGNPGLGFVLIIACTSIPLAAFSSIQSALYTRDLDFKTLFRVRIVSVFVPLVVTVPLAFWLRSYWALVIGGIAQSVVSAVLLTLYSKWKPQIYYSFGKLKEMLSFSVWSMVESISIWLTCYFDIFLVSTTLSMYYLGLYRASAVMVTQVMSIITATTTPILFSALSRLQNDEDGFRHFFFRFQKLVGLLIIPIGAGIFCFHNLMTDILLGDQWMRIAKYVGLWGLMNAVVIVLSRYASEVYRAKGHPKLSVLAQWLHIIVLWPTVWIAVQCDFDTLCISRCLVKIEMIAVNLIIMKLLVRISPWKMVCNIFPSVCASGGMMALAFLLLSLGSSYLFQFAAIFVCGLFYFGLISLFPYERNLLKSFVLKRIRS